MQGIIDGICPSCKQEAQFKYVGKHLDGRVMRTCQSCDAIVTERRIGWIKTSITEKTFFDKFYALWNAFGEVIGIIQDLDAEIGTGGDLDYHLREKGYADRIKSALAKAKILLGED